MKRTAPALFLLLALAPAALAAPPQLRLSRIGPPTVIAKGFEPAERVRLAIRIDGEPLSRWITASAKGTFRLALRPGRCRASIVVAAVRADGSRVRALVPELRCPPEPDGSVSS
jgi:hypothetical protein